MTQNKQNARRGAAMVVVICVMFVFVALSLSILLSASNLSQASFRERVLEQANLSCVSFGDALSRELSETKIVILYDQSEDTDYSIPVGGDTLVFGMKDQITDDKSTEIDLSAQLNALIYRRLSPYLEYFAKNPTFDASGISPVNYWFYYREDDLDSRHANAADTQMSFVTEDSSTGGVAKLTLYWSPAAEIMQNGDLHSFTSRNDGETQYFEQNSSICLTIKIELSYNSRTYSLSQEYLLSRTIAASKAEGQNYRAQTEEWTWKFKERY